MVLFQSTAGPETGRSNCPSTNHWGSQRFNPRPARRPAAPLCQLWTGAVNLWFQSTAGPETGRSAWTGNRCAGVTTFQSTAGPETGRSTLVTSSKYKAEGFQSTAGPETGRSCILWPVTQ